MDVFTGCLNLLLSHFQLFILCFVMRNNLLNSLTDCEVMTSKFLKAQLRMA